MRLKRNSLLGRGRDRDRECERGREREGGMEGEKARAIERSTE